MNTTFKIVTDTSSNLNDQMVEEYGVKILPLTFLIGENEYLSYDQENKKMFDLKTFYNLLRKATRITTSAVNSLQARVVFEKILKAGEDLIYIGFSSGVSSTFQNCNAVIEELKVEYPERTIIAIDSLSGSFGEGLLVIEACKLQKAGKTIEQVAEWVEENRLKSIHYFKVDTLYYLSRGGRIGKLSYIIGTALDIKPLMHINDEGKIVSAEKPLGTRSALKKMVNYVAKTIVNPEEATVYIAHGDCYEEALYFKKMLLEKIKVKDFVIEYLDLVMGAHGGPGLLLVNYLGEARKAKAD